VVAFVLWRYERRTPHDAPAWGDRLRAMRRPAIVLALAVAALALGIVAAGCSEGEVGATPQTVEGTLPQQTTPGENADLPALKLTGDATAGKAVFESAGCTACHTLSAAGSTGTVGPNLDQAKPSFDLVVQRVTLGQGGMPSFKDQLQPQQIADVAEFVSSSAGG
jgi:mono/diheme cytochrome c family protein